MSLYPCSVCGKRPSEKLASVTWAWNNAAGERSAWRQRLCTACFVQHVLALPLLPADAPLNCVGCGIDVADGMDPVFATSYIPGQGKMTHEWPLCGPCAVKVRNTAQTGAQRLEDQRGEFGGLGPGPQSNKGPISAEDTWFALGLRPR